MHNVHTLSLNRLWINISLTSSCLIRYSHSLRAISPLSLNDLRKTGTKRSDTIAEEGG